MSERGTEQRQASLPSKWTLVRDILSFLGGWVLIFLEVQRPEVRESVLVLAAGVVGVPAVFVGAQSVADALARRNGTDGQSSSPPEPAASGSQPPPS